LNHLHFEFSPTIQMGIMKSRLDDEPLEFGMPRHRWAMATYHRQTLAATDEDLRRRGHLANRLSAPASVRTVNFAFFRSQVGICSKSGEDDRLRVCSAYRMVTSLHFARFDI
jgi:hypothetical protein